MRYPGAYKSQIVWYLVAILATTRATAAFAQLDDHFLSDRRNACIEKFIGILDQHIAACNYAIGSNWYQGRDLARLYFSRSTLLNEKGDTQAGVADLDAALKAWRDIVNDIINRAAGYLDKGKFDIAAADLEHVGNLFPGSYPILANRASAYFGKRDLDRAAKDVNAALAVKPEGTAAIMIRGDIALIRGDIAAALRDYDSVQQLEPQKVSAYNASCYARALVKQDIESRALPDCEKALALRSGNEHILDSRGFAHLQLDRYADAIADYDAALAKDAKLAPSLYGRGIAKQKLGDAAGGAADMAAAEAITPGIGKIFGTPAIIMWRSPAP